MRFGDRRLSEIRRLLKNQGKGWGGGGGEGAVDGTLLQPSGPLLEVKEGEGGYDGDVVAAL